MKPVDAKRAGLLCMSLCSCYDESQHDDDQYQYDKDESDEDECSDERGSAE